MKLHILEPIDWTAAGGVLLMVLMFLVAALVTLSATIGLINRQFKETTHKEQEARAFQGAEAGVYYILNQLNSGVTNPPKVIAAGAVTEAIDATNNTEEIVDFTVIPYQITGKNINNTIGLRSFGFDTSLHLCQQITAELSYDVAQQVFIVSGWNHNASCEAGYVSTPPGG